MGTSLRGSPQIEAAELVDVFCQQCGKRLTDGTCPSGHSGRALVKAAPLPAAVLDADPLLRLAVEKDLDIEKLKQLIAMRNAERAAEAARAFAAAMADFQKRCPRIDRGKLVDYITKGGVRVHYKHAELSDIQAVIAPICGDLGLSYSWSNTIEGDKLTTVCTVLHRDGHTRSASFTCPVENNNPGMSAQQKPAGALTFGERYTIIQAFGLVTEEPDTDGEEASQEKITERQATDLKALAEEVGVKVERVLRAAKVERLEEISAAAYPMIVRTLEAKRGQAKPSGEGA